MVEFNNDITVNGEILRKEKNFAIFPIKVKVEDGYYKLIWLGNYISIYKECRIKDTSGWSAKYRNETLVTDHWSMSYNNYMENVCAKESCDTKSWEQSKYCLDCYNEIND